MFDREDVRRASRLEDVVADLTGEPPKPATNGERRFRCKHHGDGIDEHPSGRINLDKQVWFCDVCRFGGDVFAYVMREKRCNFKDALTYLAKRARPQRECR